MDDNDRQVVAIKLGPVSLQWCKTDPGPCVQCEEAVGLGLVGFTLDAPDGPLCDGCMLELNKDLGMLLMMAQVIRELASQAAAASGISDPWQADQIMVTLMMFAKIYDQSAPWPRRPVAASELVEHLRQRIARVPKAAVEKMLANKGSGE